MMNDTLRESTVSNEVARSIVDEYATTEQGRLRDELDACIELNRELQMEWAAWQARAEAAENDLRELRENTLLTLGLNPVDVTAGMEDQSIAYLLGGWKERIAELEAQLAATAWRPVTEPPANSGRYHVLYRNAAGNLIDDLQFWHNGAEFPAACWHGSMAQNGRYAEYWRPLPPPPSGE